MSSGKFPDKGVSTRLGDAHTQPTHVLADLADRSAFAAAALVVKLQELEDAYQAAVRASERVRELQQECRDLYNAKEVSDHELRRKVEQR